MLDVVNESVYTVSIVRNQRNVNIMKPTREVINMLYSTTDLSNKGAAAKELLRRGLRSTVERALGSNSRTTRGAAKWALKNETLWNKIGWN